MRLAVPCEDDGGLDSRVASHFGRARYYVLVDAEGGGVSSARVVRVPFEEHGPGDLPNFLRSLGVDVVLAYGMGPRAQRFFSEMGIRVVTGAAGRVGDVVSAFLAGSLRVDEGWAERPGFREHGRGSG